MISAKPFEEVALELHHQYGSVQRIGPKRVMFSDISAIPVIYGTSNVYEKVSHEYTQAKISETYFVSGRVVWTYESRG